MNEQLVQDLDDHEFRFRGELIAERQSQISLDDEFLRTFTLRIFGVEDGGFVSVVEYVTNCPEENDIRTFEYIEQLKDVENFFLVFEANEVLGDSRRMSRQDVENRSRISRRLAKQFEALIFPFLDEIPKMVEAGGFFDKPEEKKKSFWKLLV